MKNWKKVKLGTLLTESKIISENPNPDNRIRVKLNVLGVEKRPMTKDKKGATRYYVRKTGQFIYGKQNLHKGAFGIVSKELDGYESSSDIPAFDIDESCYSEWIFYFFRKNNFYLKLENLAKGVGSKRIQPEKLFNLDIYVPSKEEQRKILDKIKIVEFENQKLLKEFNLQKDNIYKLRKSILLDGVQGKLTEDWRVYNPHIESASSLLKEIKTVRNILINEQKTKSEKALPIISKDEISFLIPDKWVWCRLGDIINLKSGQDLKPHEYSDTTKIGLPYITGASNLQSEKVIIKRWTNNPKSIAYNGDLLITCKGSGVGKMGWLEVESAHVARQIMAIKTLKREMISYVKIILDLNVNEFKNKATGLIPGIDRKTILETIVSLPPLKEQNIIIERVNKLQNFSDKIEKELSNNIEKSQELVNSVLKELLGDEKNKILNKISVGKISETYQREIKYNTKTINMDLIKLLKVNGKLHAEDLWKMSEHYDDKNINDSIDKFYSDLKTKIEIEKTIKEVSNEKGYIELV
ncbi:restriction endonuclease subunit S [Flavobacterium sp. W1B]|uniref:restriction endonuclease subunit S n=1 Tax=Flavobacterium sp. W1B TaxID=3394146 RepID=UPI0039BD4FFB